MKSVKAAWDKAPSGPKKDAALKHYQAAEKAHTAKNDAETIVLKNSVRGPRRPIWENIFPPKPAFANVVSSSLNQRDVVPKFWREFCGDEFFNTIRPTRNSLRRPTPSRERHRLM
ncbi:hypothetical protein AB2B41_22305 [Marimonas sp. MJW-29]|uniref:HMG box domain-containing protein n=1 Tax=Sulfitobacter sediminis TaxID=3234186 RepID=A0ABV3RTK5_9RHOB